MCTHLYVPPNHAGMCDAWMDPDVVFTVYNIEFCVMFIMLGIKFIWIGLLPFGTIRFSIVDMYSKYTASLFSLVFDPSMQEG